MKLLGFLERVTIWRLRGNGMGSSNARFHPRPTARANQILKKQFTVV